MRIGTPAPASRRIAFLAIGFYLLLLLVVVIQSAQLTGEIIYPLDDTYIAMAMARNLAEHGVWGVTRHEFSSSTSTPLFVLLLALVFRLTAAYPWWPLVLASGFGVVAICIALFVLRETAPWLRAAAALAVVVLVPLPVLGFIGMEHSLHLALCLLLLYLGSRTLAGAGGIGWPLMLVTTAAVATRYETLGLVGPLVLFACWRRQFRLAGALVASAAIPVLAYGLYSVAHGAVWLPNSVLLKTHPVPLFSLATPFAMAARLFYILGRGPHMIGLLVAMATTCWITRRQSASEWSRWFLLTVLLGTLVHLEFADLGWVYRYEGYLIGAAVVALALCLPSLSGRPARFACALALAGLVLTCGQRTFRAFLEMPRSSENIFSQQVQMGRFLSRFYPGASVAANDVGAINYYGDIRCLDLTGLASRRIFKAKWGGSYTTRVIESEAARQRARIALVYDDWFTPRQGVLPFAPNIPLPAGWRRVGRWKYKGESLVLGSPVVSFYALRPEEAAPLLLRLREFQVPETVEVQLEP